jgi:hypothetical protein
MVRSIRGSSNAYKVLTTQLQFAHPRCIRAVDTCKRISSAPAELTPRNQKRWVWTCCQKDSILDGIALGTDKTRVLPNTPRYLGPRDCVSCEHHIGRHTIMGLGALASGHDIQERKVMRLLGMGMDVVKDSRLTRLSV